MRIEIYNKEIFVKSTNFFSFFRPETEEERKIRKEKERKEKEEKYRKEGRRPETEEERRISKILLFTKLG